MEVKMNGESSIGARKGGLYGEVAFLWDGHYRQVSLHINVVSCLINCSACGRLVQCSLK